LPSIRSSRAIGLVLIALTLTLVYGIWYSYSVVMVALLREFGWSRSVLAGVFSVFTLVHGIANPVIGWICGRMQPARLVVIGGTFLAAALWLNSLAGEPWQLYLSFGVVTAVGVAASGWVPALVQAQRRYPHRLGLALGIVSSGVGIGMLTVVPFCQVLIDAYGWRTAYRALGIGCLVWVVPVAIYLLRTAPRPADERAMAARSVSSAAATIARGPTLAQAVRTLPFWLLFAVFFLGSMSSQTLHVHQVVYLVDHGMPALVAASVVGLVGGTSIFAKIGSGWLSDRIGRELVFVACICILVIAVGVLVLVGMRPSALGAYGYAVLLGVGYSATAALPPAMAADRFSGRHYGAIVGIGLLGAAVGSALGPWLAGLLFDVTGSYALPLAITATGGLLAAAAGWGLWRLRVAGASAAGPSTS